MLLHIIITYSMEVFRAQPVAAFFQGQGHNLDLNIHSEFRVRTISLTRDDQIYCNFT